MSYKVLYNPVTILLVYYRFIIATITEYYRIGIPIFLIILTFILHFFLAKIRLCQFLVLPFSNDIYLLGDIILVYLKVGMHQWSILSQLLFALSCIMASPVRRVVVY